MKIAIGFIVALVILGGGYYYVTQPSTETAPAAVVVDTPNEAERLAMEGWTEPQTGSYTIIPSETVVAWAGSKPLVPGYIHNGTIALQEGVIAVDAAGNNASGSFILDMTQLEVTSLGGGKAGQESRLESHLKNSDFFDIDTYPTATFEITSVARGETEGVYTVTGNLTLKDVTESITFPAMIYGKDDRLYARADFTIDRTQWGITFGSSKFIEGIAENAIGDAVTISLTLNAIRDTGMVDTSENTENE
jgi:polyisoprenoid-binding protein YceI